MSFSLRSPEAARVALIAQNGPQTGLVVSSAGVAGPLKAPKPLACVAVRYSVVALSPPVGWVSNPGGTVRAKAAKNKHCRAGARGHAGQQADHRLGSGARADRVRRPRQRPRRRDSAPPRPRPCSARPSPPARPQRCCATAGWRSTCTCRPHCGGPARTSSASPARPSWAPGRRRRRPRSRSRCGHESHRTTDGPDATRGEWLMSGLHAAGKKKKKKKKKKKVLRLTVPMVDRLFWRAGFGPTEADRAKWKNKPGHVARRLVPEHQAGAEGPVPTRDGQRLDPHRRGRRSGARVGRPDDPLDEPVPGADGLLLAPPLRERPRRRPVAADAAQAGRAVPQVLELRRQPERELPRPGQRRHRRPVDAALPDGRGQRPTATRTRTTPAS